MSASNDGERDHRDLVLVTLAVAWALIFAVASLVVVCVLVARLP